MEDTISKLVEPVKIFDVCAVGRDLHKYFEENIPCDGIVVEQDRQPAGIIMRNDYYQKIGQQYGYSLYMPRTIDMLMKTDILILDSACDLAKLGFLAMNRSQNSLYDFIIVIENGKMLGVISIRNYLIEMSKVKEREIQLLEQQSRVLKESNDKEVQFRIHLERLNDDLNQKNSSIKSLMDNAGQGFFFFHSDMTISNEFSNECIKLLGYPIGGKNFLQVMSNHVGEDQLKMMREIFENAFRNDNTYRNYVYLSLLPPEIRLNNKDVQFVYKIIHNEDQKSIMVILTDVTDKKRMEQKIEKDKEYMNLVIKAIRNCEEIKTNIKELKAFFEADAVNILQADPDQNKALAEILRSVHTFKGNFAQLSMHQTSRKLHGLEDKLYQYVNEMNAFTIDDLVDLIHSYNDANLLHEDMKLITDTLGADYFEKEEQLQISKNKLDAVEEMARNCTDAEIKNQLFAIIKSIRCINFKDVIRQYSEYTKSVADRLNKKIADFVIIGDDISMDRYAYSSFSKALVHVFRNIADHAIEMPDHRIDMGKPEYGYIYCRLEIMNENFMLTITDDGKGFDLSGIQKKAVEKHICTQEEISNLSEKEILDFVFYDNFSTKSEADMLSGRGIGLSAVNNEVQKLGGCVSLKTKTGYGSEIKVKLPVL